MGRMKRILSFAMVIVVTIGFSVSASFTASAKELHSVTREWNNANLVYWNDKESKYLGMNSYGNLWLDIPSSGWTEIGLKFQTFALNDGISVDSYYGIIPNRLTFDTQFYIEDCSGVGFPFSDISEFGIQLHDSNGLVASSYISSSDFSYSYVDDGYRHCSVTLDVNLLDYFSEDLFKNVDLQDFSFIFDFVSADHLFYDASSSSTYILIRPLISRMKFWYSVITDDDIANEKLDNVNSNLDNVNSNLDDLNNALTGGADDYEGASSDVASDSSDIINDASQVFDDIEEFDKSWQDSVQGIYDALPNAEKPFDSLEGGLVIDFAEGTIVSRLWSLIEEYREISLFFTAGLLIVCVYFFLRR